MGRVKRHLAFGSILLAACPTFAATGGALHLDGAVLGLPWVIPFVGVLLSIAVMPLALPSFWHHHFGKVAAAWALAFLVPFTLRFGVEATVFELLRTLLLEYLPFIILLLALFTVRNHAWIMLKYPELDQVRYGGTLNAINQGIYRTLLLVCAISVLTLLGEIGRTSLDVYRNRMTAMR